MSIKVLTVTLDYWRQMSNFGRLWRTQKACVRDAPKPEDGGSDFGAMTMPRMVCSTKLKYRYSFKPNTEHASKASLREEIFGFV